MHFHLCLTLNLSHNHNSLSADLSGMLNLFNAVPATQAPGTQPVQFTGTPTRAGAQNNTNALPADLAGKVNVQGRLELINAAPATVQAVCQYLHQVPGIEKPEALRGLSTGQLEEVRVSLHGWMEIFKPQVPTPAQSVSPIFNDSAFLMQAQQQAWEQVQGGHACPQPTPVHVGQQAPVYSRPVQQVPVQHVPAQQVSASSGVPVRPPVQVMQYPPAGEMGRGTDKIKLPPLSHFSGDTASSKLKTVLSWLRHMTLALQQEQAPDPASLALMHLDGVAANWRDTVFLPLHVGQVVPWITFEDAFKQRFMDRVSCLEALKDFRTVSQRDNQSVGRRL